MLERPRSFIAGVLHWLARSFFGMAALTTRGNDPIDDLTFPFWDNFLFFCAPGRPVSGRHRVRIRRYRPDADPMPTRWDPDN